MKILGMGIPELLITLIIPLTVTIVCAIVSRNQAKKKGYSTAGFTLMGFFLGVIGLIIALVLPSRTGAESTTAADILIKYKRLLDEGAITQEEFDRKKQELL